LLLSKLQRKRNSHRINRKYVKPKYNIPLNALKSQLIDLKKEADNDCK
jgi:hypothetical protein